MKGIQNIKGIGDPVPGGALRATVVHVYSVTIGFIGGFNGFLKLLLVLLLVLLLLKCGAPLHPPTHTCNLAFLGTNHGRGPSAHMIHGRDASRQT